MAGVVGFLAYSPVAYADSYIPSSALDLNFTHGTLTEGTAVKNVTWVCDGVVDEYNIFYSLDVDTSGSEPIYSISGNPSVGVLYVHYSGYFSYAIPFTPDEANFEGTSWGSVSINYGLNCTHSEATSIQFTVHDIETTCNYSSDSIDSRLASAAGSLSTIATYVRYWQDYAVTLPMSITTKANLECTARLTNVSQADFNTKLSLLARTMPTVTMSHTVGYSSVYYSPYSKYEILSALDTKLYNIWVADNLVYRQLLNDSSSTFASQLQGTLNHEIAQAHSDSVTTNNNILYDSSGSTQKSATVKNNYVTANDIADQAVDAAVPSYEAKLDEVENYDFASFFTSQNSAVTFWRDVGEFILDSSNLGYIASGLIIVTIIGLFVYLLRL